MGAGRDASRGCNGFGVAVPDVDGVVEETVGVLAPETDGVAFGEIRLREGSDCDRIEGVARTAESCLGVELLDFLGCDIGEGGVELTPAEDGVLESDRFVDTSSFLLVTDWSEEDDRTLSTALWNV